MYYDTKAVRELYLDIFFMKLELIYCHVLLFSILMKRVKWFQNIVVGFFLYVSSIKADNWDLQKKRF